MHFSKSNFLPLVGLFVLLFFMAMSYFNNHIFLDKIVLCSFILGVVFFAKMRVDKNENEPNMNNNKYTDPT